MALNRNENINNIQLKTKVRYDITHGKLSIFVVFFSVIIQHKTVAISREKYGKKYTLNIFTLM